MAPNPDKSEAILLGSRQRAHSYSNLATVNVAGTGVNSTGDARDTSPSILVGGTSAGISPNIITYFRI